MSYANNKFTGRFNILRKLADERKLVLEDLTPEKYDELWNEAKRIYGSATTRI